MSTGPGLESLVDQTISVITNDGRNIVGILKGFDQATNIILDESHERVYSTKEGVQQLVLGLYIIRGDNMYGSFTDLKIPVVLWESWMRSWTRTWICPD
ncbi:sm-like protein LSM8 isoform X2 [Asparagus officinalis]|uniref:sm-like protein LSM8 isoform X2 n=1 Tax=Asparagus officinalis TaxID=4686 RepID=UPI00098E0C94|nr:sm-like protein LSM8 isoform X2 [Asparagus officinalis]